MSLIDPSGNEVIPVLVNTKYSGSINKWMNVPAFYSAFIDEFFTIENPRSQHVNAIKSTGHGNTANNNKMERINGEIRDREKDMRGLKIKETTILKGMQYTIIIFAHMKGLMWHLLRLVGSS